MDKLPRYTSQPEETFVCLFVWKTGWMLIKLIKCLLILPTPPCKWRRRTGDQLKTAWATTIKTDLEPLSGPRVFGHAQWRKDWLKVSSELAQDSRAWSASVRDVVYLIDDAGSTRLHKYKRDINCEAKEFTASLIEVTVSYFPICSFCLTTNATLYC